MIPTTSAHAGVLAAIHAAAFPPEEVWTDAAFATQLGLPGVFGLLDPAGGFVLARVAADEAEVLTIAVHPDARRASIGRTLLAAAIAQAAQAGAAAMFLEVSDRNHAAQRLYARTGFEPAGRRRRYYPDGSDALVLRRAITCGAAAGA